MLGITFKENCPDIRNTRIIDIITFLEEDHFEVPEVPVGDFPETQVLLDDDELSLDTDDSDLLSDDDDELSENDYTKIKTNQS
mgnify:CR=1 FL=1